MNQYQCCEAKTSEAESGDFGLAVAHPPDVWAKEIMQTEYETMINLMSSVFSHIIYDPIGGLN